VYEPAWLQDFGNGSADDFYYSQGLPGVPGRDLMSQCYSTVAYILLIHTPIHLHIPPEVRLLGADVYRQLKRSVGLSDGNVVMTEIGEGYPYFSTSNGFESGINQNNQSASDLWLAAYIGNYIGNCLSFLNDFLQRVETEPETQAITKLLVNWGRVGGILGGLAALQVLFGLAALLYCQQNLEVMDHVSAFSSMFTGFPFFSEEERWQDGVVHQGRFVREGAGYQFRWVSAVGAEENVKGA